MFDINRRDYSNGRRERPSYRGHFYQTEITGETSRSWIAGPEWDKIKIPKKTGAGFYDLAMIEDEVWINEHKPRILRELQSANVGINELKQISAMIGYTP